MVAELLGVHFFEGDGPFIVSNEQGLAAEPPFPYLGSYVEYVERTGSEAAGVHQ
mgnify:CR=1 FL=1